MKEKEYTPMMKQYLNIKENYKDSLLFFRLGDFYEMFFNDALIASRELEIALTSKSAGKKEKVPMCGVPHHSAEVYIKSLVEKGYKVAVCEQTEKAGLTKGIVKREVVKVITPGTDLNVSNSKENNFIVAISEHANSFTISYTDLSTGEMYVSKIEKDIDLLISEILSLNVKEVITSKNFKNQYLLQLTKVYSIMVSYEDEIDIPKYMLYLAEDIDDKEKLVTIGRLTNYLIKTQKRELMHLQKASEINRKDYLSIDIHSSRNLEILETLRTGDKKGTLIWLLDKCQTSMGSRNLKKWISRPLTDIKQIQLRQDFVEEVINDIFIQEEINQSLKNVYDLERIIGRVSYGTANPKEINQLKRTLSNIPNIKHVLDKMNNKLSDVINSNISELKELYDLLNKAVNEEAGNSVKDGNIIKKGYNDKLDELLEIRNNGTQWLKDLEISERERTGISSLKIGYNKIFGYYIEIRNTHKDKVKEEFGFIRKQTLANAERYITANLKEKQDLILGAKDKIFDLEYDLFVEIREICKKYIKDLQISAKNISYVDTLQSFAKVSVENNYVRPSLNETKLDIKECRHPVVEKISEKTFVNNDISIEKNKNIELLTGPNMSGKSTYMRQIAMASIMAQIGCYVAASSADIKIFDKIFTRIGSADDLSGGKSTFMVEMIETNNALSNATENSLILFDEIGRGTSTYDGMAIAQSIVEYVHQKINCMMIFSTHYHEMTELENSLERLKNIHASAEKIKDKVIFLHKIKSGPAKDSFGVNVASLANLPKSLVKRAKNILEVLENKEKNMTLFDLEDFEEEETITEDFSFLKDEIESIDVNSLTPIEALNALNELKNKLK